MSSAPPKERLKKVNFRMRSTTPPRSAKRRLQFSSSESSDEDVDSETTDYAVYEDRGWLEDASASLQCAVAGVWAAVSGEDEYEVDGEWYSVSNKKNLRTVSLASSNARVLSMLTLLACAILGILHVTLAVVAANNRKIELQIHLQRSGEKFEANNHLRRDLAEPFVEISKLDEAVRLLWENHQATKAAMLEAGDEVQVSEDKIRQATTRVSMARAELQHAEEDLATLKQRHTDVTNKYTRMKIVHEFNKDVIEAGKQLLNQRHVMANFNTAE